jgi:uncharacterized protein (TIGR02678 family)
VSQALSEHELEREQQVVHAFRALLKTPLMCREHEAFTLVRRHHPELRRRFADLLGYELALRGDHARLRKKPFESDASRPQRVHQANVHADRSRPFTRRHYALFCLALATLERSAPQTIISWVAENVISMAREAGIPLDFNNRDHRQVLAEAIQALVDIGALSLVHGSAEVWVRGNDAGEDGAEMSLYDVNHSVLADMLIARDISSCQNAEDVIETADEYAPTDDGRNRRLRHRVARRLVEQPVLYINELADDERDYYVSSQRPHLDGRVGAWCGLQAERRAEGTAMVDTSTSSERALTDLRFPYNIADRQVALLLCPVLAEAFIEDRPLVGRDALLRAVRDIVSQFSALEKLRDQESVALTLDEALSVLERMKLIRAHGEQWEALPALARFAGAEVRDHSGAAN